MALSETSIIIIVCVSLLILAFFVGLVIYLCKKHNYKLGANNYEKLPLNTSSNAGKYRSNINPIGQDTYEKDRGNSKFSIYF